MRQFHSYGPVDCQHHFCVARKSLVQQTVEQLIGIPTKGGYYFTIWGQRQTGKTWLMRQVKQEISQQYGDKFTVFNFSFGDLRGMGDVELKKMEPPPFPRTLSRLLETLLPDNPTVTDWADFHTLFSKKEGLWDRPLILLIDEVDTAPPVLLDLIVGRFRELYLNRETNWLHGLAMIGVRAVVGLNSQRGSPFNIQQSLAVPNLTRAEVDDMYQQYQTESGQKIEAVVVENVYHNTQGQPGLVSWFGELLTKKYNPGHDKTINVDTWAWVWHKARFAEPNNMVINIVAKARDTQYQNFLTQLFTRSDLEFAFHDPKHNYLYMHGIIKSDTIRQPNGDLVEVCRFSSPFVQDCLYNALGRELIGGQEGLSAHQSILTLPPADRLTDVFRGKALDLPALLARYKDYLARLKGAGLNPWKEQPRRKTDYHLTEAVGHFHLYAWLKDALGKRCVVSPEFPTGNGKVDLHLRCADKQGIIEIKSFKNAYQLEEDRGQAAEYARSLGLKAVTMAVFVPLEDETVLAQLSEGALIAGVQVKVVAIAWV